MSLKKLIQSIQKNKIEFVNIQNIEHSTVSGFHWFNLIKTPEVRLITDRAFTGFDLNPEIAFAKAVSEYIERESFSDGHTLGLKSCQTERSDGFAAYPVLATADISQFMARENALSEAIERFAWATWWDDINISFDHSEFSLEDFNIKRPIQSKILFEINIQKKIQKIHVIRPKFQNYTDHTLYILVVEFDDGIVTGGACGKLDDEDSILTRAVSELLRHALVLIQNKPKPQTLSLYEERLLFYGSQDGKKSFYKRINNRGNKKIIFPDLAIDEKIPSVDSHSVHRCLFMDQPPFIGGAIDRMCL